MHISAWLDLTRDENKCVIRGFSPCYRCIWHLQILLMRHCWWFHSPMIYTYLVLRGVLCHPWKPGIYFTLLMPLQKNLPLCNTCSEEQDAPIPMEGNGTGVQVSTVVTRSKPSHDVTPYPVITRSSTPSYYEVATMCTKCTSTLDYCHCAKDVLPVPSPAEHIIILSPVPADALSNGRTVGYDIMGTVSSGASDAASAIDICSSCKDDKEAKVHWAKEVQPVRVEVSHGGDAVTRPCQMILWSWQLGGHWVYDNTWLCMSHIANTARVQTKCGTRLHPF